MSAAKFVASKVEIDGALTRMYTTGLLSCDTLDADYFPTQYQLPDERVISIGIVRAACGPVLSVMLDTYLDKKFIYGEMLEVTEETGSTIYFDVCKSTDAGLSIIDGDTKPRWDSELRELWFQGQCCKKLTKSAPSQEKILAKFEEQHWITKISDPLSETTPNPKELLSDIIYKLNKSIEPQTLKFMSGGGTDIVWRPVQF